MDQLKNLWARFAPSISARLRLALYMTTGAMATFTLLRLFLLTVLASPPADRPLSDILQALAQGALRDLGVALIFGTAYLVLFNIRGQAWPKKWGRGVLRIILVLGVFLLLFSAIAEILFWDEFDSRLNGIALYYLIFPREVIGNLQESFNAGLYTPMVAAFALLLTWLIRRPIAAALNATQPKGQRLREFGAAALALIIILPLARALPLDISANREVSQLSYNGWNTFISAAFTNDQDYDGVYPGMDEQEAIKILRKLVAQPNTTFIDPDNVRSILRYVDNGNTPRKLNIVIVTNESFGSKFVDVLDNPSEFILTPALNKLSKESLFFTNIYPSGDRTVRGLEATETGFTPIPGISTTRRDESLNMYSLPYLLKSFGYNTTVLYGGRAIFDNMGTFWEGIGFDPVWDEANIRHDSFTTAWGVSDEDLYTEALQRMDELAAEKKPFLLTMMTVSNHRPYEFPQDHVKTDPKLFNRYNSARYADWAYGDFIARAKSHGWFNNTVFVFVADHSEKVNGSAQVPLQNMRIPFLIYSPKNIAPQIVPTLGAQLDLIPTLMGQLGFSYVSPFFGKDIMKLPADGGWTSTAFNFSIAYARPGHAVVLRPQQETLGYAFTPGLTPLTPEAPDPETVKEAIALTQTAHHMFYHDQYHMPADLKWPQYNPATKKLVEATPAAATTAP